jgi:hypothetical protein
MEDVIDEVSMKDAGEYTDSDTICESWTAFRRRHGQKNIDDAGKCVDSTRGPDAIVASISRVVIAFL